MFSLEPACGRLAQTKNGGARKFARKNRRARFSFALYLCIVLKISSSAESAQANPESAAPTRRRSKGMKKSP
jgi:hypothetical protein